MCNNVCSLFNRSAHSVGPGVMGTFRDLSGTVPEPFRDLAGTVPRPFRDQSGAVPGRFWDHSGNCSGNRSGTVPGPFYNYCNSAIVANVFCNSALYPRLVGLEIRGILEIRVIHEMWDVREMCVLTPHTMCCYRCWTPTHDKHYNKTCVWCEPNTHACIPPNRLCHVGNGFTQTT